MRAACVSDRAIDRRVEVRVEFLHALRPVRATQADLLLTLRKGRVGSAGGRVRSGQPTAAPGAQAPQRPDDPLVGTQFASTDDLLKAFDPANGDLLRRATLANGLAGERRSSSHSARTWPRPTERRRSPGVCSRRHVTIRLGLPG